MGTEGTNGVVDPDGTEVELDAIGSVEFGITEAGIENCVE